MTKTLKEAYAEKKLKALKENIKKLDNVALFERRLIEAMDETELQTATKIIEKLKTAKGLGIPSLDVGIDAAVSAVNKYTGGGKLSRFGSKLKGAIGMKGNPLIQALTFANALENGIKQLPTIIKNNVGDIQDQSKSVFDTVTDAQKQTIITNNIVKALAPSGTFSQFKVPFVDKKQLTLDILRAPIQNLTSLQQKISSGPQATELAQNPDVAAPESPNAGTGETKPTEPTATAIGTTPTEPAKATTPSEPSKPAAARANVSWKELEGILIKLMRDNGINNRDTAAKVADQLHSTLKGKMVESAKNSRTKR